MVSASAQGDNPFQDPSSHHHDHEPVQATTTTTRHVPATLNVGRDASLTLATDSLVVLDEALRDTKSRSCCGLPFGTSKTTRSIPFYNVLWAETSSDGDGEVVVHYAHQVSKNVVRPQTMRYSLDKADSALATAWVERLLERSYGASQQQKRIKVLINPFGGKGKSQVLYNEHIAPILAAAHCHLDVMVTQRNGHGIDIAKELDIEKYDVVACCSGDGIPHEVFNGLGQRSDAARALQKIAVAQMPCGSGNAMSLNCTGTVSPSLAALAVVKGIRTPLDLTSVTQDDRRTLSFLSQSVGIIAEVDLATEHLRWMGSARFTYGVLVRLLNRTVYPADIAVKVEHATKPAIRDLYRAEKSKPPRTHDDRILPSADTGLPSLKYGTINDPLPDSWELVPHDKLGNFYAGNLAYMSPDANFFPGALPSDGYMDLVRVRGDLSRSTAVSTMLAVENLKFFDLPQVDYQKISAYRIIPKNQKDGYISIDGERIPFEPFQAEVHKALGTILTKTGHMFEAEGV